MRPIDADALKISIDDGWKPDMMVSEIWGVIDEAPTVATDINVPNKSEIVRCKDCRYGQYCTDGETTYQCFKWNSNEFGALHEQDWFCADGKRKEGR